ncbi:DUF222 domain-containing protein [Glutamicibacter sp.]|uniref:HNH endonuclease signature motif containing protein n=1 Tax=Glutamicibacter sp. TaxID=1931995 RepID=UPI003D6A183A
MTTPAYLEDNDGEHRLPLRPPGTRTESHKTSPLDAHREHQVFFGPLKQVADELFDAGPVNGPGDALERLKKIQRLQSSTEAVICVLLADAVEQVSESFNNLIAAEHAHTAKEEAEARKSAEYYGVDRGSEQIINSNFIAESAIALRESSRKVSKRMFHAKGLRHVCKATLIALAAGEITAKAARDIVKYSQDLSAEQITRMEQILLPLAKTASDETIYQRARRLHDRMNPDSAENRQKNALAARNVKVWNDENGMAILQLHHRADVIHSIRNSIKHVATQITDPKDPRTQSQVEADALVDVYLHGWPGMECMPLKPRVAITIPAMEMLANPTRALADLEGYGPIPIGVALEIAADAPSFQRVLTDPWTGAAIDVEPKKYRPSQGLRDLLRHRDQHCGFPGCRRPADRSEIDHIEAYGQGGHTTRENTHLLCKQHQMFKHALGWKVFACPDGSKTWVSPHGLRSITIPASVDNVEKFDHVNDHCPRRPQDATAYKVQLTPEVRRVLGLGQDEDLSDTGTG